MPLEEAMTMLKDLIGSKLEFSVLVLKGALCCIVRLVELIKLVIELVRVLI